MFVRRPNRAAKKIIGKQYAVALAVATVVGLSAAPAIANRDALPAAYFSLASYRGSPERAATQHASKLIELERRTVAQQRVKLLRTDLYRARNFKVLNYKRKLKVRDEAVVLRMKSPGKRKSIVSLELNF